MRLSVRDVVGRVKALMKNDEPTITTYEAWVHSPYKIKAAEQGWALTQRAWPVPESFESWITSGLPMGSVIAMDRALTGNIFNTDEEAYEFVKQQAEKGDKLALTALSILFIEKLSGG